jgi:hypothetical protein
MIASFDLVLSNMSKNLKHENVQNYNSTCFFVL